jgi:hypothetical protein
MVVSGIYSVVYLKNTKGGLSLTRDNSTLDRELNQLRVVVQV